MSSRISLSNVNLHYPSVAYAPRSLMGLLGRKLAEVPRPRLLKTFTP